jgi:hypothetical protein
MAVGYFAFGQASFMVSVSHSGNIENLDADFERLKGAISAELSKFDLTATQQAPS